MENKQIKCTCERPDDYACDYCDEQESKRILKEAKERYSEQETLEKAAKKEAQSKYGLTIYEIEQVDAFIDGAKWQAGKMYSEEDMKLAFETGRNFQLTGEDNFNELIEQLKK